MVKTLRIMNIHLKKLKNRNVKSPIRKCILVERERERVKRANMVNVLYILECK
jgi:hypothetical protein